MSFSKKIDDVRREFRKQIVGGITNVYHRYIDLSTDLNIDYLDAQYNDSLDLYTCLTFLDFNALYLYCMDQQMPTGPGLKWERKDHYFRKVCMKEGTSFKAMQWLTYIQDYGKILLLMRWIL